MKIINQKFPTSREPGFRRRSPQQQLWEFLSAEQKSVIGSVFKRLKIDDQEDLCYALLAFLKYGIEREFTSQFMQQIFESFKGLIRNESNNNINNVNSL